LLHYGALAPGDRVIEVGAGTGKATELLAQRGLHVLALEPSHEMAAVARARCAGYPEVELVETEFERWTPTSPCPAVVSVQAWHWIAPEARYDKAHAALIPGGTLAAIWSFPDWANCGARESLRRAYRSAAPDFAADFPMHPSSRPTRLGGDWHDEIEASGRFGSPEIHAFAWSQTYTSQEYVALLQTHQDHILLPDAKRSLLLGAVARGIDGDGGSLELPLTTYVCLARRPLC
jgi:SAM-dependent methyltransferase